ncbi:MAG: single-stranded-DNA-specific exonuclease RecJ [Gammaproteobacteria bacterium]
MSIKIIRRSISQTGKFDNLHPVLERIYAARDIKNQYELDYGLAGLINFGELSGIESAVALLVDALAQEQRILIVADFDADGATSCALAVRGLRAMGAKDVRYVVPNRFEYGYGLTPEIVEVAARENPDLIITVDNGIASNEGVAAAKKLGIKVLVTDHHLPGDQLPDADAIVNPNQPNDVFPSKSLAGVGVMFYVLMALRSKLREIGWFEQQKISDPNLAQWLDIVALGTVADVVPLDRNNRILVSQGLARIRKSAGCVGIRAISEVAKRDFQNLTSTDLGFAIGPRLNAAGRLDDMSLGIECLLSDDQQKAKQLAIQLDQLNHTRREIGDQMLEEAVQIMGKLDLDNNAIPFGLCLHDPDWHQGVIGILASRIKEQHHRPVIVFATVEEGELKGSARSVNGVHIRDVLDAVATQNPHLINKFGGHAMAAGLTLAPEHYEDFKQAFDWEVRKHLNKEDMQNVIKSDGELSADQITIKLAEQLRFAGPWGQAFPEPVFDGVFIVENARIVAEKHLKVLLRIPDSETLVDGIAFNITNHDWPNNVSKVEVAYQLDLNEFRGNLNVQMLIRHIYPIG